MSAEVFNSTPLPLMLTWRRLNVGQLGSLDRSSRAWPAGSIELRAQGAPRNSPPLGVLGITEGQTEFTIRPDNLRSAPADGTGPVTVVFENDCGSYVDISKLDPDGTARLVAPSVAPGARSEFQGHPQQLWAVRSTFAGELLDLVSLDDSPTQIRTIDQEYLKRSAERVPLPSPLPAVPSVSLIGGVRERPRPESREYILISQQENQERPRFNTRKRVVTRSVQVAGVKLVWSSLDKDSLVMPLQGAGVLDLDAIDMYADTVPSPRRCASPVPRSRSTPGDWSSPATDRSTRRRSGTPVRRGPAGTTTKGRSGGAKNKPTYRAENGLPGEPAGDIRVLVSSVKVPPG